MTPIAAAALVWILMPQAPQQPLEDARPRAQAVLRFIEASEYAKVEEQFTPEMKAALPPGRLAAMWTGLRTKAGAFKGCSTDVRVRRIADKQMVITPCDFERGTFDIQFAFDSTGRISGLVFRPVTAVPIAYTLPPYANPSSYAETETTIGTGEWVLPATLAIPSGSKRVPAVILVHGSGPQDRDETIAGNKPFKDLAVGLASRGIAVLRYDKRTKVHGAKLPGVKDFTVRQEVIDDVVEAGEALRAHPRVDASRVFVLGHSLGGMLVPRIARADPTIAGFIVMAGVARPLGEAIVEQTRYLAEADGSISAEEQQAIDRAAALAESVRGLKAEDATSGRILSGAPASYWLDLREYDAPSSAKSVKAPMLVLQGERDFQVTGEDFAKWKSALGSRTDVVFQSYPTLNHLFITGRVPSVPAEYQVPGHVAEEVIRDIATWILIPR